MGPFAGPLPLQQRGDDRSVEGERRRMVAHAGDRARRQISRIGPHLIHEA